ncbi:MAG: glycosyltransferase [Anaerolineae bacterium]|nr:glycosyltransferase [Phycisphaerae bacterium]
MHYCFFTSGTWQGNASMVRMREIGNEFLAREHRVTYLVDDVPYNHEKLNVSPKAQVVYTPNPSSLRQIATRRKLIKQISADFVHVLNPSIKAWLALAGMPNQKVVGDWDEWPARRDQLSLHRRAREKFLDRWMRNRSMLLVVASRYLQKQFKDLFNLDAEYIPYATYLQQSADGHSPHAEPAAVYMGSFYSIYDHGLLLEAALLLQQQGLRPNITLVGDGDDMPRMREFVAKNELTNLHLVGYQSGDDLWRHLRHARVLLFPIRETLLNLCRCPSKTFAYVQAKRPVIANKVGEVAEVLGDKGIYVEPTAQSFADAIEAAMKSPATESDVEYDLSNLTWSARADALLAALGKR